VPDAPQPNSASTSADYTAAFVGRGEAMTWKASLRG
jgi:hypothetical protein